MRFGWASALALTAVLALSGCNRGVAGAGAAENLAEAEAYLAKNAGEAGVTTLPSGVQYRVVEPGPAGGVSPDSNDLVRVDYQGSLINGDVFDSSYQRGMPAVFQLDEVVPGWTDALQHMKVGDEWQVYIPPELGYGEAGRPGIPSNALLIFRVRLLGVAETPGGSKGSGVATG